MIQRSGRTRFLLEAREALGIGRNRGGKDLDRHIAPEPRIARAIDLAHPAGADGSLDFIRAQAIAHFEQHGRNTWIIATSANPVIS